MLLEDRATGATATRLRIQGDLDLETAPALRTRIASALTTSPWLKLDLSEVTFFGSTGIRTLLEAREEALRRGDGLAVVAASPAVRRVLDLAGLGSTFSTEFHGPR